MQSQGRWEVEFEEPYMFYLAGTSRPSSELIVGGLALQGAGDLPVPGAGVISVRSRRWGLGV